MSGLIFFDVLGGYYTGHADNLERCILQDGSLDKTLIEELGFVCTHYISRRAIDTVSKLRGYS